MTKAEKEFHDKVAQIGCIACLLEGIYQPVVSIHHTDGRTKSGCQRKVLPLCAGHHQDGTGAPGLIAVHPWKARFEARYGTQEELVALINAILAHEEQAQAMLLEYRYWKGLL